MQTNTIFYSELSNLRDLFHKYGKFDDANAKLDEIAKYISIYVYQTQFPNESRDLVTLIDSYEKDKSFELVKYLKEIFLQIASSDVFKLGNNISVFGEQPSLNITEKDNEFAYLILKLVINSVNSISNSTKRYDILNECFGHFVRANFRNHVEDAQYMTPNEAVDLMCDIVFEDIDKTTSKDSDFVVMDPCCGVGSFLSSFYHKNTELGIFDKTKISLVGQDKVERMVRLSKINMVLANIPNHVVANGNSVVGDSLLNKYVGKVDLILTNPPFGAKFSSSELKSETKVRETYPLLYDTILKNGTNFSSEVLFVDRCISLLKEGGKLLAVLPDSVISSGGLNSTLRHRLANNPNIEIKAIIELPAVTFAQAGTRTKTSILYLEKKKGTIGESNNVFVSISENIGFEVSTKKGATVKQETGINDLPNILKSYIKFKEIDKTISKKVQVITESPSCVYFNSDFLKESSWTPNHYKASKFIAVNKMSNEEFEIVKLSDIAKFGGTSRRRDQIDLDSKCISVLHVSDEDLNYEDLMVYKPKYHGIACKSGDLLFSKINPRIMRVIVVPQFSFPLTCSSEFEIINSTTELSNYGLKLLLMSPMVQEQINSSTSGTSSSHNRIKTVDLANILIPIPKKGTRAYNDFITKAEMYEKSLKDYNSLKLNMLELKNGFFNSLI